MRVEKHIINFDQSFCTGSNHYYLAENKIVIMDSPGSALVAILYIIILYYINSRAFGRSKNRESRVRSGKNGMG